MSQSFPLLTVDLRREGDLVPARQRARQIAELLHFEGSDPARIATAVSEIARNALRYAGGGRVEFAVESRDATEPGRVALPGGVLVIRISDSGPGIGDLDAVLEGRYRSRTGMGLGIRGARRLSDRLEVQTAAGQGTTVTMERILPARALPATAARVAEVARELSQRAAGGPLDELETQNQELMRSLFEVRTRQEEIERLNHELEETNRGVLALYAELEDRAHELRRASELKSGFLSSVSHELRTPLSSILNLSRLLLDAPLSQVAEEPRRQVQYIRKSAQALFEIVNDLLDIAKIEAGKTVLRASEVHVGELLGTLRGVFRPLVTSDAVTLVVEPARPELRLFTDEGKLAQILRNFLSNAVKYTERGEIRLRVVEEPEDRVTFEVADTGIGIDAEHLDRIFEEFVQIEGPHQARAKGTGLGLPLARRIAELLGGAIRVRSAVGQGSTFALTIPRVLPLPADATTVPSPGRTEATRG